MQKIYLLKIGEIALKGKNRSFFERKLRDNIRSKLKGIPIEINGGHGRYFLTLTKEKENEAYHQKIEWALKTTFGLTGYAVALKVEKNETAICQGFFKLIDEARIEVKGFKADCRRSDKSFSFSSMEMSCLIGEKILERYEGSFVDLHTPPLTLHCEIREMAYLYLTPEKAPCGLPVGVAGRGTLMLSGGIDSPVAGWMMAKRGLKQDALYFHAYPFTSDEAKNKVIALAQILAPWLDGISLFIVNFTDIQMEIKKNGLPELSTLFMRCCMMEIADRISRKRGNNAIITGEALSQVASQTTESLRVTSSHTDFPILRPCIGMDKEEIIDIARKIKTFETSILPFEDCCTLFSPKHPIIRPDFNQMKVEFSKLEVLPLIEKAIEEMQIYYLDRNGKKESSIKA